MAFTSVETSVPAASSSESEGRTTARFRLQRTWERELAGWLVGIVSGGALIAALAVLHVVRTTRMGELLVFDLVAVMAASLLAHIACRPHA